MQMRSMPARFVLCAALIGLGAAAAGLVQNVARPASAAPPRAGHSSPLVGIVEGQRAHLTLAHPNQARRAGICEATLAFVDIEGQPHKHQRVRLGPGQGTFLAFDWTEAPRPLDGGRLHYRAVFTPHNNDCEGAVAGHEMVENDTQKTTVFIGVYLD